MIFRQEIDDDHIQGFGLLAPCLSLSVGVPFVLPPAGVIPTAKTILATLQSRGARYLLTVPSILEAFVRLPRDEGMDVLRDLEIVAVGGAPMKDSVGRQVAAAGVNLLNHWGAYSNRRSCKKLILLNDQVVRSLGRLPRFKDFLVAMTGVT